MNNNKKNTTTTNPYIYTRKSTMDPPPLSKPPSSSSLHRPSYSDLLEEVEREREKERERGRREREDRGEKERREKEKMATTTTTTTTTAATTTQSPNQAEIQNKINSLYVDPQLSNPPPQMKSLYLETPQQPQPQPHKKHVRKRKKVAVGGMKRHGSSRHGLKSLQNRKVGLSDYQWSARFQTCLENIRNLTSECGPKKRMMAVTDLMHLSEDFVHAAQAVGKMIISEVCLPHEEKVIKPVTKGLGGRAGGEKYLVHDILFKFSLDRFGLFGGSDLAASKVSGHELKGLMAYFSLYMKDINFPLMALVDYRGFRLVAISVLPVRKDTLIYGTNNAGIEVVNKDKTFSKRMDEAAKILNIKSHICGMHQKVRLSSAADIEGHKGVDGQYYLLDFSRSMPPVRPKPGGAHTNSHLYQLFRREFVRTYGVQLCSDAYSGFILLDEDKDKHNNDVDEATFVLENTVIPRISLSICQSKEKTASQYCAALHKGGVNLRYLGMVIMHIENSPWVDEEGVKRVVTLLTIEAVSRVIKNELNRHLREKVDELRLPQEVPYRILVVQFLNLIFGFTEEQRKWWGDTLLPLLGLHFNFKGVPNCLQPSLRVSLMSDKQNREKLFSRVVALTCLKFSDNVYEKIRQGGLGLREPIGLLDLVEIGDRVKSMDIIFLSQGNFYLLNSLVVNDPPLERAMLKQAVEKYMQALNSVSNKETLLNCSLAYYRLLTHHKNQTERERREGGGGGEGGGVMTEKEIQGAIEWMNLMIVAEREDSECLCVHGMFLDLVGHSTTQAELSLIRSLTKDATNGFAMLQYFKFLDNKGFEKERDELYNLMTQLLTVRIISPVDGAELGGTIKIFMVDGSFKSFPVHASQTGMDVLDMVCTSQKFPFNLSNYQLCTISLQGGGTIKSNYEEGKYEVLLPQSLPWVMLQRESPLALLFCQRPSPMSPSEFRVLLTAKYKKSSKRITVACSLISFLQLILKEEEEAFLGGFFFSYPLFAETRELTDFFLNNYKQLWFSRFVSYWGKVLRLVEDKGDHLVELVEIMNSGPPSPLSSTSGGGSLPSFTGSSNQSSTTLTLTKKVKVSLAEVHTEKKKCFDLAEEVDNLFQTINSIDQKLSSRKTSRSAGSEYSMPFLLRQLKPSNLEELAKNLMIWVLIIHNSIDLNDFLDYMMDCQQTSLSVPLQAAAAYETAIQNWVITELHSTSSNEAEAIAEGIASYGMFAKLMIKSYKLGDFSTSFTIAETLVSPTILSRHKVFREHPQFPCVRSILLQSKPFQIIGNLTSPQKIFEKYEECTEQMIQKGSAYIGQMSRLMFYLNAIGPVASDKVEGVNVIRCAASFETIQRYWSNDLTTTKIKDIMTSCDPNILVKLATRLGESKDMINRHRGRQNKFGLFLKKRKKWDVGTDLEKEKQLKKKKRATLHRSTMILN